MPFLMIISLQSLDAYNVNQAVRYADKWVDPNEQIEKRNPFYYPCDNDCANFVSQCLIAGGFNLSDGGGYGYNIYGRHSIVRAGDFPYPGLGDYLDEVVGATVIRDSVWHEEWEYISSPHPYPNDYDEYWTITQYGADSIKVHFSEFETESSYDYVYIYDEYWNLIASYTGNLGSFWTPSVPGHVVNIEMVSDASVNLYGFEIDRYKYWQLPEAPWDLEPGDVIIFGDPGDLYKHVVIVVGGSGNYAYCNAHSNDRWHRYWYEWMDGTFPQSFSIVTFFEIPFSAGGSHNLTYYQPPGWPAPLIVSAEPGNHDQDCNHIVPGQSYYIDWAMQSNGYPDIPDTVKFTLYLDNSPVHSWYVPGLWTGDQKIVEDSPIVFNTSSQTLSIKADP